MPTDYTEQTDSVFFEDCQRNVAYLDSVPFRFTENGHYFVKIDTPNDIPSIRFNHAKEAIRNAGLLPAIESYAISGSSDFGHTAPDWETIIKLGIPGLKQRIFDYQNKNPKNKAFYSSLLSVWEASERFIERVASAAETSGRDEMAKGLRHLLLSAPSNLFEGFQLIFVIYVLQMSVEQTALRTLGRIDSVLGRFCKETPKKDRLSLIRYFLLETEEFKVPANIPFALGGTNSNGLSLINPFSYEVLDVFLGLTIPHVKIHMLVSENMPEDFLRKALVGVRSGKNSIVFLSDETVIRSLEKIGEAKSDAMNYSVVGCYECGGYQEIACTCNGIVNIAKAVEYALTGGIDMMTGNRVGLPPLQSDYANEEDFLLEIDRQLIHLCCLSMKTIDLNELDYKYQHASPFMTSFYSDALKKGCDIYTESGARYNNSSINAIGLATAADSLFTISKLVFQDKTHTLTEVSDFMKNNWEGSELLRLTVKNKYPKFGQGEGKPELYASRLVSVLDRTVNQAPNVKGGVYRLGTFSIDWRWNWGKHTSASLDGRLAGEPLSQNSGATFGFAKNGATAHLSSVASVGGDLTPNGGIVDIDFHISQVRGENGLSAMETSLRTYFALGGFAVHYNVMDTEILKAARENPTSYPDLQVRLCGWNVLFSLLSDKEKDEFIRRSEVGL